MRRFLAFIFGMIFGIVFIFAALAGAIFVAVAVVHPNQVTPESEKYIGDLADMSLVEMIKDISALYKEQLGKLSEEKYFTLGQFMEHYHIDFNEAFGFDLPQDVLDIPAFEFFNTENGVENAMKQIKVSSIPAIVNMFGTTNEDGTVNGMFSEAAVAELSNYSLYDLLSDEEKGVPYVFQNVKFADILADMFPAEDSDNKLMWAVGQSSIGKLLSGMSGENNMLMQLKPDGAFAMLGSLSILDIIGDSGQYVKAIFGDMLTSDLIGENGQLDLDSVINGVSLGELLGCQKRKLDSVENYKTVISEVQGEGENAVTVNLVLSLTQGEGENQNVTYAKLLGENYYEAELTCDKAEHTHGADCPDPCDTEKHVHSVDCYGFVWYSTSPCETEHDHAGELLIEETYYAKVDGLYSVLANTSVSELTGGNSDALISKFKVLKISEILGDNEISGVLSSFSDLTIGELMDGAIDSLFLGVFFSLKQVEIEDLSGFGEECVPLYINKNDTQDPVYYLRTDSEGNVALSADKEVWYEGEFVCQDAEHGASDHTASCYGFKWYSECADSDHAEGGCENDRLIGETYCKKADGIQNKLASKQIRNLQYLNDELKQFTLRDVLGDDVPDVLKDLADTPIGDMNSAINNLYLGGLLSYTRERFTVTVDGDTVTFALGESVYVKNTADCVALYDYAEQYGFVYVLDGGLYAMSDNERDWFTAKLVCKAEEHVHGDACQSPCPIEEHTHANRSCYAYIWYNECKETDHAECDDKVIDGVHYKAVENMMAKLAQKRVSEMGELNETVLTFTMLDVFGSEDKIPSMLRSLANVEIGELSEEIDKLYIGDVLKSVRNEIKDISQYADFAENVKVLTSGDAALYVKSDDGKVWYEAELDCREEHAHTADCFAYVWYEEAVCELPDHSECNHDLVIDGVAYDKIDGITKHIVNITVGNLSSSTLTDAINKMTLGEVLTIDENTNQILVTLKDVPIGELSSQINTIYLGSAMNYVRNPLDVTDANANVCENVKVFGGVFAKTDDGKVWYEAKLDCVEHHGENEHTAECYSYVWYEKCADAHDHTGELQLGENYYKKASGITTAFVNAKLDTIADTMNNMTIGRLGINIEGNNLLIALKDSKLNDLGTDINNVKMGVVLGYKELDNAGVAGWYEECKKDDHSQCSHLVVDGVNYVEVKGLNGKIADKTVGELAGGGALTDIAKSLTIGDLIDSGMMTISEQNGYKLAIIFCGDDSHGFTETVTVSGIPQNVTYGCDLAGYFQYLMSHSKTDTVAQEFWTKAHPAATDAHKNAWRNMLLSEFIDTLLGGI